MSERLIPRLGVNIDHVATLRQARGESYPSIAEAARVSLENGAEQITIHLREDRRHIQDTDVDVVKLVTRRYGALLNFEMGCADDIIQVAISTKPDWICLVPEKREEKTTEGGLDLLNPEYFEKIKKTTEFLKQNIPGLKVSLFVEAKKEILQKCIQLPIEAVEIHTGDYAHTANNEENLDAYIAHFHEGRKLIKSAGLGFHAGHGLTQDNLALLLKENLFEEYNIGHWIICQAVFEGLAPVVQKLRAMMVEGK